MTTAPFDIPAPLAGPVIAILTIAATFLATVNWTHPNRHDQEQP